MSTRLSQKKKLTFFDACAYISNKIGECFNINDLVSFISDYDLNVYLTFDANLAYYYINDNSEYALIINKLKTINIRQLSPDQIYKVIPPSMPSTNGEIMFIDEFRLAHTLYILSDPNEAYDFELFFEDANQVDIDKNEDVYIKMYWSHVLNRTEPAQFLYILKEEIDNNLVLNSSENPVTVNVKTSPSETQELNAEHPIPILNNKERSCMSLILRCLFEEHIDFKKIENKNRKVGIGAFNDKINDTDISIQQKTLGNWIEAAGADYTALNGEDFTCLANIERLRKKFTPNGISALFRIIKSCLILKNIEKEVSIPFIVSKLSEKGIVIQPESIAELMDEVYS